MITTIVSFVIVLGILVFIHEFGHYWIARRNGIVVEEFGMGYPPRLVKLFTYDGTDFTINMIPFGGFARMKGEDAADMSPGAFNAASRGGRAATLLAGPVMNALFAIVLFAASSMAGFPASAAYPQISADASKELLAKYQLEPGDILQKVNGEPLLVSAFADLDQRWFDDNEEAKTITVSRQGELIDLTWNADQRIGDLLDAVEYTPVLITKITGVAEATSESGASPPAAVAGLQVGDIFYSVNDEIVTTDNLLNEIISRERGNDVTLTILRDDQWMTVDIRPRTVEETPPGQGSLGVVIGPITQLAKLGFLDSLRDGVANTFQYFGLVLQLPYMALTGQLAPGEAQLTGPVGIAQMIGSAASATIETRIWFPILQLSAILSAALAITNLLPLPALDGGRLLFILIETVRGRRISPEREGMVHMVGFVLLLGLIAIITVRDISSTRQGIDWLQILGQ